MVKIFLFSMVFFDLFKKVSFTFIQNVMLKSAIEMPINSMCPILSLNKNYLRNYLKPKNYLEVPEWQDDNYVERELLYQVHHQEPEHKTTSPPQMAERHHGVSWFFYSPKNIDARLVGFHIFHLIRHTGMYTFFCCSVPGTSK